jgi:hypothetical protein
VAEWERLKLIYPHEAQRLTSAYRSFDVREDDWIFSSRALTPALITLYLGAFLLIAGSLFYFIADRVEDAVPGGLLTPFLVLGVPFVGLNVAGHWLYRRQHQVVGVAFYLGALGLLPLFLLIAFNETGWWTAGEDTSQQFFTDGWVSNRQLQITTGVSWVWASWLALRTRTSALSTAATIFLLLFALGVLTDFGLRTLIDELAYDRIALRLAPIVAAYAAAGWWLDRDGRPWFARPSFVGAAIVMVIALDLFALDGKMLHYAGITLRALQPTDVEDPVLIDTLAALSLNGLIFYLVAAALERRGAESMRAAATFLAAIAPFSMLEPLAWLCSTHTYFERYDWLYLTMALTVAMLSYRRQRRSFYYAGVANAGFGWGISIVVAGLAVLGLGFAIARKRNPDR